jgi:hypothetical protein
MLILVLALHAAAIATPPLDLQRHPKRSVTRSVRRSRHRVRTVALRPVLPACRAGSVLSRCARPDSNAKYRLGDTPDESVDAKARALQGPFRNCGVTGMPVCPSNGQKIIDTNPR